MRGAADSLAEDGERGVSRCKWTRTAPRDGAEAPVPDLVERDFAAARPNALS